MKNLKRENNEPPYVIAKLNWRYHHLGIPTKEKMPDEEYLPQFMFYVSGFNTSPFGIEWMRFEDNCPISEIIKTIPHIAFEVDDLDKELDDNDFEIIGKPESPSEGVRTVMIRHNRVPIELIEFEKK